MNNTTTSPRGSRRVAVLATMLTVSLALTACGAQTPTEADDTASSYPNETIEILAPGGIGGGWDTRARVLENALTKCGIVDVPVRVTNIPGAGGTIGLAYFSQHEGDPHQLMMMSTITMLGGIIANQSEFELTQFTPIAGLTTGPNAIVVPAHSPYQSLDDLLTAIAADPVKTAVVGGSLGGTDHLLLVRLAGTEGVDPTTLNYTATGGGGEMVSLLISDAARAGSASVTEVLGQVEAGELRVLAVTGAKRIDGVDAPTLTELGLEDAEVAPLAGVMAPPGLNAEQQQAVVDMIEAATRTTCWEEGLEANNWERLWIPGDEWGAAIARDRELVEAVMKGLGLAP